MRSCPDTDIDPIFLLQVLTFSLKLLRETQEKRRGC